MVEIHLSAKELTRIGQWYELMYASGRYEATSSDISLNLKICLMAEQLIQDDVRLTELMDNEE